MNTLLGILEHFGSSIWCYDLGRRITAIPSTTFHEFERGNRPYPYPIANEARFALAFSSMAHPEPVIWLLKLKLDEQGLVDAHQHSTFMQHIQRQLLNQHTNDTPQEHPFAYQPPEEKMAMLHSKLTAALKQPVSMYFDAARDYFCGDGESELWQTLALQGVTDLVNCLPENTDLAEQISQRLSLLPAPARNILCTALEHITPPSPLANALSTQLAETAADAQASYDWLRALSGLEVATLTTELQHFLMKAQTALTAEHAIIIAGRLWPALHDKTNIMVYFDSVAKLQDQSLFNSLYMDLVALPELQSSVRDVLRTPERSSELAAAIGGLFASHR